MSLETRAGMAAEGLRAATAVDTEVGLARLRRTHRRRSATRVTAAGVGIAAMILAGTSLMGNRDSGEPAPAGPPSSTASPSRVPEDPRVVEIPATRSRQVLVEPKITSDVTPGEQLLDSTSSGDPAYDGGGSIELSVGDTGLRQLRAQASCADAPDAWYVMLVEPSATYIDTGRCDRAVIKVGGTDYHEEFSGTTLRMFVTDQNPRAFRQCFEFSPPEGCDHLEHPLRDSGATMRLATYEWHQGPPAARMFDQSFPARANAFDQTWSLTSAAAAATGARTLSFRVEASSNEGLAQVVYFVRNDACSQIDGCNDGSAVFDHPSLPAVELSIDGEVVDGPPREGPFFGGQVITANIPWAIWDELAPGQAHDITIELVGGDASAVDVGVIVYEAD